MAVYSLQFTVYSWQWKIDYMNREFLIVNRDSLHKNALE